MMVDLSQYQPFMLCIQGSLNCYGLIFGIKTKVISEKKKENLYQKRKQDKSFVVPLEALKGYCSQNLFNVQFYYLLSGREKEHIFNLLDKETAGRPRPFHPPA